MNTIGTFTVKDNSGSRAYVQSSSKTTINITANPEPISHSSPRECPKFPRKFNQSQHVCGIKTFNQFWKCAEPNTCLFNIKHFMRKVYTEVNERGPRYGANDDNRVFPISVYFSVLQFIPINPNRLLLAGYNKIITKNTSIRRMTKRTGGNIQVS